MYKHRISQYNFPSDIDKKFDFMYEAKTIASSILLQQIDTTKSFCKEETQKSFHHIMCISRNSENRSEWVMITQVDMPDVLPYISVYLKTQLKSINYYIFLKIPIEHLGYLVKKFNFKEANLKLP